MKQHIITQCENFQPMTDELDNEERMIFDFEGEEGMYRVSALKDGKTFKIRMPTGKFIFGIVGALKNSDGFIAELEDGSILKWMRQIFGVQLNESDSKGFKEGKEIKRMVEFVNAAGDEYTIWINEQGVVSISGPQGRTRHVSLFVSSFKGYTLSIASKMNVWQILTPDADVAFIGLGDPFLCPEYETKLSLNIGAQVLSWWISEFKDRIPESEKKLPMMFSGENIYTYYGDKI